MALSEVKNSDWYKELSKDMQEEAIKQQKEYYTPPDNMQNTLLNLTLGNEEYPNVWKDWLELLQNEAPWADPKMTRGAVGLLKQQFFTEKYLAKEIKIFN